MGKRILAPSLHLPYAGPSWHLKAVPVVGYPTQEMKIERFTVGHRRQQGRLARSS